MNIIAALFFNTLKKQFNNNSLTLKTLNKGQPRLYRR